MSSRRPGLSLAVLAFGCAVQGCAIGTAGHEGTTEVPTLNGPPPPRSVQVPNVIGDRANAAASRLEAVKLRASFSPAPRNADLCRIKRQSEVGVVPEGTTVGLSLRCDVVIPDVVGLPLGNATDKLVALGFVVSWGTEGRNPANDCTVVSQDQRGAAPHGSGVVLNADCPITVAQVRNSAAAFAQKFAQQHSEGYAVTNCVLTGTNDGSCDVSYVDRTNGISCTATIDVTDNGDSYASKHSNVNCRP